MAPMTGLCHYAWDCIGYTKECGSCPALYSKNHNDQSRVNYTFKKMYIDKTEIIPVAATEWQFKQLYSSSLYKDKRKFKVLLSIDEKQYCPANKTKARQELGLPNDKKIIFFRAGSASEKRKGFKKLIETLNILSEKMEDSSIIHLAIAGKTRVNLKGMLPFSCTLLGYLDHNTLPKAFQAADVFVSPSIEDSGPMMVNQSIMCGTPVVAFEMGVVLDLVITGQTGYRAKLKDNADLAKGLKYILKLNEQEYKKMSENCRALGLELCHLQKQAEKYIKILETSVNKNR